MVVDLWTYESGLYPAVDAAGMNGKYLVKAKHELGEGNKVEVEVYNIDKTPLNLHQAVDPANVCFRANFWNDSKPWFRIDTDTVGYLHCHLESGTQQFEEHVKIPEDMTIAGCISKAFDRAQEIINWKHPEVEIVEGKGFVGFMS